MKRKMLALLLAAAMVIGIPGCGSTKTDNAAGTSNGTTQGTSAEETGPSVVRMSIQSEPDSLDPWQSAATDTEALFHNVFEGLLLYDSDGNLIPGLAESYDISEDGLVYTFHLREDVDFHNGKHFTSSDVLYTYNNLAGMNGEKAVSSKFTNIVDTEAPDDYTFVITLAQASASFLCLNIVPILPEGYDDQAVSPVGTGPYCFESYTPGQSVTFKKNENYYDADRAGKIDRVEVYIMSDRSASVAALQSGQLDFTIITPENADMLQNDYAIYNSPQNMIQIFALNNEVAPFNDIRVRQAMNFAVDKDELIAGVFSGYATKLYSNFSPVMAHFYNDQLDNVYTTDIDKAKELLAEAGYADGFDMTITVPANYQTHINTAQVLAQQLEKVGIHASIETIEWASWLEDVYANAKYQSTVIGLTGKLDPNDVLSRYSSDYPKNFFRFSDPEYDELVSEAALELDDAKRVEMYQECQKILTEKAAAVYLTDPNNIIACRKDLKGYTFYPVGFYNFSLWYYEE